MVVCAQENGLVPLLEVDVLLDGDHSIATTLDVSERVWAEVFYHLARHRVLIEAILLKMSMINAGIDSGYKAPPEQVADYTMTLLRRVVPLNIPGIVVSVASPALIADGVGMFVPSTATSDNVLVRMCSSHPEGSQKTTPRGT